MVRKMLLSTALVATTTLSFAQQTTVPDRSSSCPKFYLGTSTGLENPSGLLGINIDVPLSSSVSIAGGAGLSNWGMKVNGEVRYYFSPCNRGWAIAGGVTHNTGLQNFTTKLPTATGDHDVTVNLNALTNAYLSGYKFFNVGQRGHRFHLQFGYSVRLSEDIYSVESGDVLTSEGTQVMKTLAPGGLMAAIGFTFAIGK